MRNYGAIHYDASCRARVYSFIGFFYYKCYQTIINDIHIYDHYNYKCLCQDLLFIGDRYVNL